MRPTMKLCKGSRGVGRQLSPVEKVAVAGGTGCLKRIAGELFWKRYQAQGSNNPFLFKSELQSWYPVINQSRPNSVETRRPRRRHSVRRKVRPVLIQISFIFLRSACSVICCVIKINPENLKFRSCKAIFKK
ncbi:hypothetical protein L2E82_48054 [Cichorium intybus]|uniref:Uncharacterized protein n=1 Tax=Cichorium intybus TaxID=13427 RepID=A0ACB8YXG4_CICIN|nr:hypothetical protein L2E82_48054 [Cichorium intybus]